MPRGPGPDRGLLPEDAAGVRGAAGLRLGGRDGPLGMRSAAK